MNGKKGKGRNRPSAGGDVENPQGRFGPGMGGFGMRVTGWGDEDPDTFFRVPEDKIEWVRGGRG